MYAIGCCQLLFAHLYFLLKTLALNFRKFQNSFKGSSFSSLRVPSQNEKQNLCPRAVCCCFSIIMSHNKLNVTNDREDEGLIQDENDRLNTSTTIIIAIICGMVSIIIIAVIVFVCKLRKQHENIKQNTEGAGGNFKLEISRWMKLQTMTKLSLIMMSDNKIVHLQKVFTRTVEIKQPL